jgi:hypothetical protein
MLLVSHRGNLNGSDPVLENSPEYILLALNKGYDVEIDVWFYKNSFYLGHDEPLYKINKTFLTNKKFWCHAKNIKAMDKMLKNNIHCFWHQNDKLTLTNKNIPWCFPNAFIKNGITVVLNKDKKILNKKYFGICTDYILYYNRLLNA